MREITKYRYFVAGLFTLIIFVTGALASNLADDFRSEQLRVQLEQDLTETESSSLQLSYLRDEEVSCETMRTGLQSIVKGYNSRLAKLQTFQKRSLIKSKRFENIRHRYILSGIKYWIFVQDMKERCEFTPHTVLFFTSSLEATDCSDCERLGRELSLLKKEMDGNILIFSIPVGLDDGMVDVLENRYNVTSVPTMVIDGERTVEGYRSREQVKGLLS